MRCCGNKRKLLKVYGNMSAASNYILDVAPSVPDITELIRKIVTFRYTGKKQINIRSIYTNRKYHFSAINRENKVFAEDIKTMNSYAELVEINS